MCRQHKVEIKPPGSEARCLTNKPNGTPKLLWFLGSLIAFQGHRILTYNVGMLRSTLLISEVWDKMIWDGHSLKIEGKKCKDQAFLLQAHKYIVALVQAARPLHKWAIHSARMEILPNGNPGPLMWNPGVCWLGSRDVGKALLEEIMA